MSARELLLAALKSTDKTQAEAAELVGWKPQQFSARMTRDTLRVKEFVNILNALGVEIRLFVKETGEEIKVRIAGSGRRVRSVVDSITYDTATSDALSNNFYLDGVHKYNDGRARELYVDHEGRYFFAEYTEAEGQRDRINPVSGGDAAEFIERYGTEIFKGPERK